MKDLENQLRRLFRDKESDSPAVRPLAEYLDVSAQRASRWHWLVVPAAIAASAAVVFGVAQLSSPHEGPAAPLTGSSSAPAPEPAVQGHGPLWSSATVDCVDPYSAEAVSRRAFAFDGTITNIGPASTNRPGKGNLPLASVTFEVNEWFLGSAGDTATVDMTKPGEHPKYAVGTRLLVSGEPRWDGPDPMADAVSWDLCGFTRYWDPQTAETWKTSTDDWLDSLHHDACWRSTASGVLDYAAGSRPKNEMPPSEQVASIVEGTGLAKRFPDATVVVVSDWDVTQDLWVVAEGGIVGEFTYKYGEYGWENTYMEYC